MSSFQTFLVRFLVVHVAHYLLAPSFGKQVELLRSRSLSSYKSLIINQMSLIATFFIETLMILSICLEDSMQLAVVKGVAFSGILSMSYWF